MRNIDLRWSKKRQSTRTAHIKKNNNNNFIDFKRVPFQVSSCFNSSHYQNMAATTINPKVGFCMSVIHA